MRSSLNILIRKQTADKKYLVECFFTSPVNFFSFGGFPHKTTHAGFITLRCHVSRAFKELCLLSEVFFLRSSTQPAPRDLAVPCATRGRGSWAYPTASCGLFREDCRRDRALSPVNLRVRPNFLALSPSPREGLCTCVFQSASSARSHPTVPPPRERIASHAIRAWYQGPYSSLTILSSPRAALAADARVAPRAKQKPSADDHPTLEVGPAGMAADGDDASTGKAESAARQPIGDVPTATAPDPTARAIATPRTVAPARSRESRSRRRSRWNPSPESPRLRGIGRSRILPRRGVPHRCVPHRDGARKQLPPRPTNSRGGRRPRDPRRSLPPEGYRDMIHDWALNATTWTMVPRWHASAPSRVEPRDRVRIRIRSVRPRESGGRDGSPRWSDARSRRGMGTPSPSDDDGIPAGRRLGWMERLGLVGGSWRARGVPSRRGRLVCGGAPRVVRTRSARTPTRGRRGVDPSVRGPWASTAAAAAEAAARAEDPEARAAVAAEATKPTDENSSPCTCEACTRR